MKAPATVFVLMLLNAAGAWGLHHLFARSAPALAVQPPEPESRRPLAAIPPLSEERIALEDEKVDLAGFCARLRPRVAELDPAAARAVLEELVRARGGAQVLEGTGEQIWAETGHASPDRPVPDLQALADRLAPASGEVLLSPLGWLEGRGQAPPWEAAAAALESARLEPAQASRLAGRVRLMSRAYDLAAQAMERLPSHLPSSLLRETGAEACAPEELEAILRERIVPATGVYAFPPTTVQEPAAAGGE